MLACLLKFASNGFSKLNSFTFMALHPFTEVDADAQHFQLLQHFTVVLYDKTSDLQGVDEAQKGKTMERLPPIQDALIAALQVSCISGWNMVNQRAD